MRLALVINIVIALTSTGAGGQEISLNLNSSMSPCEDGVRSGVDRVVITGTVGKDFNSLVKDGWSERVTIELLTKTSTDFQHVCDISIGVDGVACLRFKSRCYCGIFDASAGTAHIVVELPAEVSHSQAAVRAAWMHSNRTKLFSTGNISLPHIYDVSAANIQIWINELSPPLDTNGRCSFHGTLNLSVDMWVCCSNMAMPCYAKIVVNGTTVASDQSPCVSYTWAAPESRLDVMYSVCTNSNYILGSACTVNREYPSKTSADNDDDSTIITVLTIILLSITGCVVGILLQHAWEFCLNICNSGLAPPAPSMPPEVQPEDKSVANEEISAANGTNANEEGSAVDEENFSVEEKHSVVEEDILSADS